jgi:hypothetical protein
MMLLIPFLQQRFVRKWELNKIDKTFILWSGVWLIYFTLFIVFASAPFSAIIAIVTFFPLWFSFCKSLENIDQ